VPGAGPTQLGGGVAVRIAADNANGAWAVTSGKAIFKWTGTSWQSQPGQAIDVAVGGNGTVYILKPDGTLARWNGTGWTDFAGGGGGMRIAVDPKGNPWVTNSTNQIWRWNGTQWQLLPGSAQDISIGPDGATYVLGIQAGPGGYLVHRWDPASSTWAGEAGVYGTVVAAGTGTHAYVARRTATTARPTITR
jgi:hypothetical protein